MPVRLITSPNSMKIPTQAGWRYGQIETRLLQALAASDEPASAEFVADALNSWHQPGGLIRTFLDKGAELVPFLHLAASQNITPQYARKLLEAFGQPSSGFANPLLLPNHLQPALVEPLSGREQEILRLLAAGHTNQEIAQAMIVSVNTVKSHLKNVYGKLGVKNRRAAVAQPRPGLNRQRIPDRRQPPLHPITQIGFLTTRQPPRRVITHAW